MLGIVAYDIVARTGGKCSHRVAIGCVEHEQLLAVARGEETRVLMVNDQTLRAKTVWRQLEKLRQRVVAGFRVQYETSGSIGLLLLLLREPAVRGVNERGRFEDD